MSSNSSILISAHSLSEQLKTELTSAVNLLLLDGKLFQFNDIQNKNSHLLVIDVDNEEGRQLLNNSLAGQVKILVSSTAQSGKNVVGLKKPVDIESFKNILSKLFETMHAQLAKMNAAKNEKIISTPANSSQTNSIIESVFYNLFLAKNNKQILHIASNELEVYIDGNNQSLKTGGSLDDIRKLILVPFNEITIKKISDNEFQDKTKQLQIVTLHNILWTAAITCSNGQLLPGHDDQTAVKLRAWPSFTRNDFKPEHLKLAAVLAQRPISLIELSKQTNINHAEIVNFYNAAFSVDLIDKNAPDKNDNVQPIKQNVNQKKNNLLNKIASRLGFGQRVNGTYNG